MKKFIIIIAAAALAFACNHEPDNKIKHGDQLAFTTEDSFLQSGDLVGVCMDAPLSYTNVKMTYAAGALAPGNKLYWPVDMPDSAVTFMAYYPYSADYNEGGNVAFAAAPDQRTDAAFRASALMVSVTKAAVTDPSVDFTFTPRMAKLVFYLRNDSNSPVKDIYFTAYPTVQFNMNKVTIRVAGEKVDIHSHLSATSADGVQAYETIFAPQNTILTLTIKTEAAEYTAMMDTKTQFEEGKQYSNARLVVLDPAKASKTIRFTLNETDWAWAPDFVYLEPITGGAELSQLTDPGLYKLAGGIATPLRVFSFGDDQYSMLKGKSDAGWRLMNPAAGEMFELGVPMVYSQEGQSFAIKVRSFGIEGFEADYTSTASTIKAENGLVWMMDDEKEYGYIIMSE